MRLQVDRIGAIRSRGRSPLSATGPQESGRAALPGNRRRSHGRRTDTAGRGTEGNAGHLDPSGPTEWEEPASPGVNMAMRWLRLVVFCGALGGCTSLSHHRAPIESGGAAAEVDAERIVLRHARTGDVARILSQLIDARTHMYQVPSAWFCALGAHCLPPQPGERSEGIRFDTQTSSIIMPDTPEDRAAMRELLRVQDRDGVAD